MTKSYETAPFAVMMKMPDGYILPPKIIQDAELVNSVLLITMARVIAGIS